MPLQPNLDSVRYYAIDIDVPNISDFRGFEELGHVRSIREGNYVIKKLYEAITYLLLSSNNGDGAFCC